MLGLGALEIVKLFLGGALNFIKKYWMYILVAIIAGFLYFKFHNLEQTTIKQAAEITTLTTNNKALTATVDQVKVNHEMIDNITTALSKKRNDQIIIKDRINAIPVTTSANDKPFSDPGLLARASVMRDHQEESYPSGSN